MVTREKAEAAEVAAVVKGTGGLAKAGEEKAKAKREQEERGSEHPLWRALKTIVKPAAHSATLVGTHAAAHDATPADGAATLTASLLTNSRACWSRWAMCVDKSNRVCSPQPVERAASSSRLEPLPRATTPGRLVQLPPPLLPSSSPPLPLPSLSVSPPLLPNQLDPPPNQLDPPLHQLDPPPCPAAHMASLPQLLSQQHLDSPTERVPSPQAASLRPPATSWDAVVAHPIYTTPSWDQVSHKTYLDDYLRLRSALSHHNFQCHTSLHLALRAVATAAQLPPDPGSLCRLVRIFADTFTRHAAMQVRARPQGQ